MSVSAISDRTVSSCGGRKQQQTTQRHEQTEDGVPAPLTGAV